MTEKRRCTMNQRPVLAEGQKTTSELLGTRRAGNTTRPVSSTWTTGRQIGYQVHGNNNQEIVFPMPLWLSLRDAPQEIGSRPMGRDCSGVPAPSFVFSRED